MERLAGGLLVAAAALVVPIAWTGDAGPFGVGALLPLLLAVLASPVALTAVGLRRLRRRPPGSGSPRFLALASTALVVVVLAVPAGDRVRRWRDERAAAATVRHLDGVARTCARGAVAAVPEEEETNPGVAIRPRLTETFEACLRRDTPALACTPGGCATTLSDLEDARLPTVLVVPRVYLDEELRRRTGEPYDRTGRSPSDPPGTLLLHGGD